MENCLVTTLKAGFDNELLPIWNELSFIIEPGTLNVAITAPVGSVVTFDNDTDTIKVGADVIQSGWSFLTASSGSRFNGTITKRTHFRITNLYGVTRINENSDNTCKIAFFNLDSALGYGAMEWIVMPNNLYSVNDLEISSIKNKSGFLRFNYCAGNLYGDLSDFHDLVQSTTLEISGNTGITGDIASLIPCKQLTQLRLTQCTGLGESSVESFLEGQFNAQEGSAGRSGALAIYGGGTKLTFNGSPFVTLSVTFGENSVTVSNGIITKTYDGNSWS